MHFSIIKLALPLAGIFVADDKSLPDQNQIKICSLADLGGTCYVETPPIKSTPVCVPYRTDIKVDRGNLFTGSFGVRTPFNVYSARHFDLRNDVGRSWTCLSALGEHSLRRPKSCRRRYLASASRKNAAERCESSKGMEVVCL